MSTRAAAIAPQPGSLAQSESLVLPPGGQFSLSVAVHAETTRPDQAPALAAFVFQDAGGTLLGGPHPGFALSERFGPFVYLGARGQEGVIRVERSLQAPPQAQRVAVHLYRWGAARVQVAGPPELAAPLPLTAEPLAEAASEAASATPPPGADLTKPPPADGSVAPLWEGGIALQAAGSVILSMLIEAAGSDDGRAPLVAALAFQDAAGTTLPGPFPGSFHSERFGHFVYLGTPDQPGVQQVEARIASPPGAAHLTVQLHRWQAAAVQLLEPAELRQIVRMEPGKVICAVEAEVGEGEPVTVRFSAACRAPLADSVLLVRPVFLNADGKPIKPFGTVPVSDKIGPYRYLQPEQSMAHGRAAASADFITPAGTVRMRADVFLWKETQTLSALHAELTLPSRDGRVSAEGRLALRPIYCSLALAGQIRAKGSLQPDVGRIELRFLSETGELILAPIKGLNTTETLANFAPLRCRRLDGLCDLALTLIPPRGARELHWRLWPAPNLALEPAGALEIRRPAPALRQMMAALPAAVNLTDGVEVESDLLRAAWPDGPLKAGIEEGQFTLLGAAIAPTTPESWLQLEADLAIAEPGLERTRIAICPTWFDAHGTALNVERPVGCTPLPRSGPTRLATRPDQPASALTLRESFLSPEGSAYAIFLLVVLGVHSPVEARKLRLAIVEADAVHDGLDTAAMDREQLLQALELATATHDLPARWAINHALALWQPKETKFARQAQVLGQELTELDPDWLPPLPLQPAHDPDPKAVLHLFKVIYPDESTGGAVRSTAIVEAQAAQGMRPVVCMPLNAPRAAPAPDAPAAAKHDGLNVVDRNGVRVCYPTLAGLERKQIGLADLLTLEAALSARAVAAERIGLVHAASGFRGYENALKGLALARAHDLPFVYEVRSFHEHTWRPLSATRMGNALTRRREAQEDRCMVAADAVVTISQAMIGNLVARGVSEDRLFFVPNAIDPHFETLPEPDEIRRQRARAGLAGSRTIGYISNFSQREGHAVLLDAFARLVVAQTDTQQDLKLVMVGDGPEWANIRAAAAKRGLAGRVVMPGNVDHGQIRLWYHMIDLFVVPRIADFASDYVTPLKPFEAMSQGVPVIMSDRPVTREIAGEAEERARIFPPGEPQALAALIAAELAAPERLAARARAARDWVLAERVWSSVVSRYQDAYAKARSVHAARRRA